MESVVNSSLRLSAQRALLGAIGPDIRLIKVASQDSEIVFSVIAATQISEEQRDALSIAACEIIADFPDCRITEEFVVTEQPLPRENILSCGWVYRRRE